MAVVTALEMPYRLIACLMYGAGLRVAEAARLRVKDVDFSRYVIIVRNDKGGKDRTSLLPGPLYEPLRDRVTAIRQSGQSEPIAKRIPMTLPFALDRKSSGAATSLQWQFLDDLQDGFGLHSPVVCVLFHRGPQGGICVNHRSGPPVEASTGAKKSTTPGRAVVLSFDSMV